MVKKPIEYWRSVVAAGVEIQRHSVTQFSPAGLAEWSRTGQWWCVALGPLVLSHRNGWVFTTRRNDETIEERLSYAHRTKEDAEKAWRDEAQS